MKYTLVIPDDAAPVCDRPDCDQPWPGPPGRELPGATRMVGIVDGQMVAKLYCSPACAEIDGRGRD